MNLRGASYERKRKDMQPGDLIAFGGHGLLSKIIKWGTQSPVSHVGVIRRVAADGRVEVVESTSIGGVKGVQVNRLSKRIKDYNGHVWWLPLSKDGRWEDHPHDSILRRPQLDEVAFWDFLWAQDGKPYDALQAFKAGTWLLRTRQNREAQFCSELVTGAYKAGNIIDIDVNESEQTPIDVCRFPIYKDVYFQLKRHKGKRKEINF